ncbi:filaggrin-2 [Zea mays]|uniref:Uncharacterized protein n=1 Tax=Zea mays TaxID=4577 RepID=A0A1D6N5H4_MAIZE|nr:filaggrin-2 [Zea mays]ONM35874.1 hypothetical protein ZEAMMB73_Zm00001d042617 [Zea mays]|eukprot:XP_020406742.1 filaggrin-2 [Zea mays]
MSDPPGETDHNHRDGKHRRSHLHHLNVQVPPVASNIGCFAGCFRPSPTSSSSPAAHGTNCHGHGHGHGHRHADRPASPSLIRSPSAWIKAKGQSLGSGRHARRRSQDFQYDALSYARNFDEGGSGTDGVGEEEATSDALKHRCFTSRLPTSPPPESPSGMATSGNGKAAETGRHELE